MPGLTYTMNLAARLLLALLLAGAAPAWADVNRDDAVAIAQRASAGRVLSAERTDAGGRPAWRVKLVTAQGEVKVILVNAASGRML